jgi:hypothetical protein
MTRRSDRRRQSLAADLWRAEETWRSATRCADLLRVDLDLSERKWRLFSAECCRAVLPLCVEPWHRETFEQAERLADGPNPGAGCKGIAQLRDADNWRRRWADWYPLPGWSQYRPARPHHEVWAERAIIDLGVWREGAATRHQIHESLITALAPPTGPDRERLVERWEVRFGMVLREIAGDPFGLVNFDPSRRTWTAVKLARLVYESHEFSLMPILADALQDAGYDNDDLLIHCRDASLAHTRGCWVVDLVLGKA